MEVNVVQQNLGNALIALETGIPQLTAIPPQEAQIQISATKAIIMDTQLRLSKVSSEIATVEMRLNEVSTNQQQKNTTEIVNSLNNAQETATMAKNKKEIKAFNLKKVAQMATAPVAPFSADSLNDTAELGEERFGIEQDLLGQEEAGLDRKAFTDFLIDMAQDPNELFQFVKEYASPEKMEIADKLTEQFNMIVGDPMKIDEIDQIAGQIYDMLSDEIKSVPTDTELGVYKTIAEIDNVIKKLAKEHVSKKTIAFNLKKTAQHKTVENVILHGPGQRRFDPFLRQPVSDWSIIERNKGFGLTFDDVWDVDYEAIWRGAVMDKYSRPYRNKDGNWVGGYINKRFEVDYNVPETNNYQLKPGQLRRATPPEYGVIEGRLQAARAAGDIEGGPDVNRTEPFNWKEASSKKKS